MQVKNSKNTICLDGWLTGSEEKRVGRVHCEDYDVSLDFVYKVKLVQKELHIHLNCELYGEGKRACDRCLSDIHFNLKVSDEIYLERLTNSEDLESEIQNRDLDVEFYIPGEEFNFENLVIGFAFESIENTGLCSKDCKGLCQSCGVNQNIKQCSCSSTRATDNPFSVLIES